MLKSDMSEKYGSAFDLDYLYSHCKVFGVYDSIYEVTQDLEEACNHSPEDISFVITENELIISLSIKFNNREKILLFKLKKEEMTLEDSNKFLI